MSLATSLGLSLRQIPVTQLPEYALKAENAGYQGFWFPEITFADVFTSLTAVAPQTKRIRLCAGIAGIWSRSPVVMAMSAATINTFSGGRFTLGLGLQARNTVVHWHGRRYEKAVMAMKEYVQIVRRILAGECVTEEGEIFRVKDFQLNAPVPESPIPIYIAAIGPKMLQLAGEIADGILGAFYSLEYVEEVVIPNVQIGAERAGRSLDDIDIGSVLHSVITEDDSGLELVKGQILVFSTLATSSPFYAQSLERAGYGEKARRIQELVARGEMKAAWQTIDDQMADAFTVSGNRDNAKKRVEAYLAVGLDSVILIPVCPGVYAPFYKGQFPEDIEIPPFSLPKYLKVVERTIDCFACRS